MPVLKPIAHHEKTVKWMWKYLTKNERDIGRDFINCYEWVPITEQFAWEQMDQTRKLADNNRDWGSKKARTFYHFILSPDPKDDISLDMLREIACEWTHHFFGEYECAIVYHDDNEHEIKHAHIVVNNTNIETFNRVQIPKPRLLYDHLEKLARERGLHSFVSTDDDTPRRSIKLDQEQWKTIEALEAERSSKGVHPRKEARTHTKAKQLEDHIVWSRRFSWVKDIRIRVLCAIKISNDEKSFKDALTCLGVRLVETKKHEWKFIHPAKDSWTITGKRLGQDFTKFAITKKLARDRYNHVAKPEGKTLESLKEALRVWNTPEQIRLVVLGTTTDMSMTAEDLNVMLECFSTYDIQSKQDLKVALKTYAKAENIESLKAAAKTAKSLDYLPDVTPKKRLTKERHKEVESKDKQRRSASYPAQKQRQIQAPQQDLGL